MPTKDKFNLWSIFLVKTEYPDATAALNPKYSDAVEQHTVRLSGSVLSPLYVKSAPPVTPRWARVLASVVSPPIAEKSKNVSAVLFVLAKERLFAITFGFGKALLKADCWEQEFGLKAVLNMVDESSIRELELSGFDSLLQNKQAQSVRDANIDEFEIDVDQDVVRSIRGTPKDLTLGRIVSGRDSLHISTQVEIVYIAELLGKLLDESEKEDYQDKFSWVGRMKEVRVASQKENLNSMLVDKLRVKDLENAWIAPPEYTRWKDGCAFQYPLSRERHEDIHLRTLLTLIEEKGKLLTLDLADLKRWKIEVVDENGSDLPEWIVYRCLYAEIEIDGETFILNNGAWYAIENTFFNDVNDDFLSFPVFAGDLPTFGDADEAAYNKRVCEENPDYCLMDRKTVELKKRGLTKIEFCDVYGINRELIHVKRYSGSSELSHLFAQGLVSAELFAHEPEFRSLVNNRLAPTHRLAAPEARLDPQRFQIVYAIVSKSENAISLPFFSKVMLRSAKRRLQDLGFRVSLCKIQSTLATDEIED